MMAQNLSIESVLSTCSVNNQTLSKQHKEELDELGYTVFHNVIDPAWLKDMQDVFERLYEKEGDQGGIEAGGQFPGIRRLADLVNKGSVFDGIYMHPLVLASHRAIKMHPWWIFASCVVAVY